MNPIHGATVRLTDFPLLVFVTSLVLLMFSLWAGARLLRRWFVPSDNMREDFGIVLGGRHQSNQRQRARHRKNPDQFHIRSMPVPSRYHPRSIRYH